MTSIVRMKTGSVDELVKARMIVALDILLKAVYDLPDIEKRLMKAKQQVLFNQNHPSAFVTENINQAYESLLAQLPILKQQEQAND